MKKIFLLLSILLNIVLLCILSYHWYEKCTKNNFFDFSKYKNLTLNNNFTTDSNLVCFVGNSITANWINLNPNFFEKNNFINRGTGGQSSSQILLRFQQDVVSLNPSIVVLSTGINDIGEADGFYDSSFTMQNIRSIAAICKANDIKLVLTSVLPVTEVRPNIFKSIDDVQRKIDELNANLIELSKTNNLEYVDYFSNLVDCKGNFNVNYTFDGLHPNREGYEIMERAILEVLNKIKLTELFIILPNISITGSYGLKIRTKKQII